MKNVDHYSLPQTQTQLDSINKTKNSTSHTHSRGIIQCDHFESEVSCEELQLIQNLYNQTLNSSKFIFISPKSSPTKFIQTLSSAFIISLITKRKLIFADKTKYLYKTTLKSKNLPRSYQKFSSSASLRCNFEKIIKSNEKIIYLKGNFDPNDLILDPFIFSRLPPIMLTHYTYFLSRILFKQINLTFPDDQYQIGISLQFKPDPHSFLHNIKRLAEGYTNFSINLWNPKNYPIPPSLLPFTRQYKHFDECFNILIQSDVFIGSLGYKESHLLTKLRSRAGKYFNPLDSSITELANSQSGELFLMKGSASKLMCPNGIDALRSFLSFNYF